MTPITDSRIPAQSNTCGWDDLANIWELAQRLDVPVKRACVLYCKGVRCPSQW